jgi:hypothetical protein
MQLAASIAKHDGDDVVVPRHIVLAILEQSSSLAYGVLTSFATPDAIRTLIERR